jgi:hypothetical protein
VAQSHALRMAERKEQPVRRYSPKLASGLVMPVFLGELYFVLNFCLATKRCMNLDPSFL